MTQVLGQLKLDRRAKPLRPGSALHAVAPLHHLAKTLVFIRFYKGFLQGLGKRSLAVGHIPPTEYATACSLRNSNESPQSQTLEMGSFQAKS